MDEIAGSPPSYRRVVAALAESEERYRILVEGVTHYAIFMLDPQGLIVTWNRGIRELLGYNREEIVGRSGAIAFNLADRKAGAFEKEMAATKRDGESISERANLRKDGSEIRVHDIATSLRSSEGVLLGFAKVTRRIDIVAARPADAGGELANALASLQLEVEHRRRLEAQLLTAVEEERERLGRDLHDDLSQRLAGLAVMVGALAKNVQGDAPVVDKILRIGGLLNDAMGVARNLSRGLHPITLTSQGLPAALVELAERVPKEVEFNWPQDKRLSLEPASALHLYRIAEEAVGNALKHSDADRISIKLETLPTEELALKVIDNGQGWIEGKKPGGMGLQNMKYRAGVMGGAFKITHTPLEGTEVVCTIPFPAGRKSAGGTARRRRNH